MRVFAFLCLVSACASLPPEADSLPERNEVLPFPRLQPLTPLLAETAIPARAEPAGVALTARREALAQRRVRDPGTGDLAQRGARLRARAEALRNAEI